jgi:hypothetical protein
LLCDFQRKGGFAARGRAGDDQGVRWVGHWGGALPVR